MGCGATLRAPGRQGWHLGWGALPHQATWTWAPAHPTCLHSRHSAVALGPRQDQLQDSHLEEPTPKPGLLWALPRGSVQEPWCPLVELCMLGSQPRSSQGSGCSARHSSPSTKRSRTSPPRPGQGLCGSSAPCHQRGATHSDGRTPGTILQGGGISRARGRARTQSGLGSRTRAPGPAQGSRPAWQLVGVKR